MSGLFVVEKSENKSVFENQRQSTVEQLATIRAKLEGSINTELILARSIIIEVETNTDISKDRFFSIAKHFMNASKHIKNIGLAKGTVLTYVYPEEGNKAAIGLNYKNNASQWPAVRRVIEGGRTVVAGPLDLVQGGVGIIGRTPIFLNRNKTGSDSKEYFGILSVVINLPSMLQASGVGEKDSQLNIAMKGKDGLGDKGDIFYGQGDILEKNPVLMNIVLPGGGQWLMAAIPSNGWDSRSPRRYLYRILAAVITLIMVCLLYIQQNEMKNRKKVEAVLRESEEKYRRIFDHLQDGYIWADSSGKILLANQFAADILGYDLDELKRKNLKNDLYFFPEERETVKEIIIRNGKIENREIAFKKKDGSKIIVEVNSHLVFDNEQHQTMEGTFRDITVRKKAEEEQAELERQLMQAQKMESVGRLAGGVAHDFNNMLSIILGNIEIISSDVDPENPIASKLGEVEKAAQRSADLTRQLLAFARKQNTAPKIINLNQAIEGMLKMLIRLIGEDIELIWVPDGSLWPVRIDPSQVDQIIANLCVNAKDSIKDTGKITIETGNIHFSENQNRGNFEIRCGDYAVVTVSDTGCGMDKETADKIFEPFFTTKGIGEGTGLGLSTVFGIIKQNNAYIDVQSEPGKGTGFKLYFPRHYDTVRDELSESHGQTFHKGSETILLVEDEQAILDMVQTMLERVGYHVLPAVSPDEAIRISSRSESEIHLVMTDVIMPSMNGRELADTLLKSRPNLKCLFMSGYTDDVIADKGVLDAGLDFINKPFLQHELLAKIRSILDR